MKRTFTRILLVMLFIVGSLFAVPASAKTAATANDTEPRLLYKTSPTGDLRDFAKQTFQPSYSMNIYLYYGTISGTQTALTAGNLSVAAEDSNFLAVEKHANGDRDILIFKTCGTATLIYDDGSVRYTAEVTVGLPSNGWFNARSYSEGNYITSYTLPREGTSTLWYMSKNGYTESEYNSITMQWSNGDPCSAGVTLDKAAREGSDRYDIKVTFNPDELVIPSNTSDFRLVINSKNGTYISLKLAAKSELLCKPINSGSQSALKNYSFYAGDNMRLYLYYGIAKGEFTPLTTGKLTSSDDSIMTTMREGDCYRFNVKKAGTVTLIYSDTATGFTSSALLEVKQREYALYDAPICDDAHFLPNISYYLLDQGTVWYMCKEGFTESEKSSIKLSIKNISEPPHEWVKRANAEDRYDLKISLPKPDGMTNYTLYITRPNGANNTTTDKYTVGLIGDAENKALYLGDYVVGFSTQKSQDVIEIIEGSTSWNAQNFSTPSTGHESYEKIKKQFGISVAMIKHDDLGDKYYEIIKGNKTSLTVSKIWIEWFGGEADTFSLSKTAHLSELVPMPDGTGWTLYCKPNHESYIRLCATVTLTINGESVTGDITAKTGRIYTPTTEYDCAALGILTVEDYTDADGTFHQGLNSFLASIAKILESENDEVLVPERKQLTVTLAPVDYVGTVTIPKSIKNHVLNLHGKQDTRLIGGIDLNSSRIYPSGICFIAPSHSQDTLTECKALYNGQANMSNCLFYGYDVALDISDKGISSSSGCVYIHNNIAIRVSIKNLLSDMTPRSWTGNTFINNGKAVQVLSLNSSYGPYNFRIINSNFINNDCDFDMRCGGTLYLYNNYYGVIKEGKPNGNNKLPLSELLGATTEGKVDQIVKRRKAKIAKDDVNKGTKVITNPRWKFPVANWWTGAPLENILYNDAAEPALMLLAAEPEYENVLLADWDNDTQIVNEEADGLVIDNSAFDEDSEGEKKIDIVEGEQEIYLGTWIFD